MGLRATPWGRCSSASTSSCVCVGRSDCPGATALLVLACGVSMAPFLPSELTASSPCGIPPALGSSVRGHPHDDLDRRGSPHRRVRSARDHRLRRGCEDLARELAVRAAGPRLRDLRSDALAGAAMILVLGFALASAWDIVGPFAPMRWTGASPPRRDQVEVERALLSDDRYAGEDGRLFADSPGVGSLSAGRILDGTSSEPLTLGIVVSSGLTVLSVFVAASALWGTTGRRPRRSGLGRGSERVERSMACGREQPRSSSSARRSCARVPLPWFARPPEWSSSSVSLFSGRRHAVDERRCRGRRRRDGGRHDLVRRRRRPESLVAAGWRSQPCSGDSASQPSRASECSSTSAPGDCRSRAAVSFRELQPDWLSWEVVVPTIRPPSCSSRPLGHRGARDPELSEIQPCSPSSRWPRRGCPGGAVSDSRSRSSTVAPLSTRLGDDPAGRRCLEPTRARAGVGTRGRSCRRLRRTRDGRPAIAERLLAGSTDVDGLRGRSEASAIARQGRRGDHRRSSRTAAHLRRALSPTAADARRFRTLAGRIQEPSAACSSSDSDSPRRPRGTSRRDVARRAIVVANPSCTPDLPKRLGGSSRRRDSQRDHRRSHLTSDALPLRGPSGRVRTSASPASPATTVAMSRVTSRKVQPGDLVLEVGCGPGDVLAAIARHVPRLGFWASTSTRR